VNVGAAFAVAALIPVLAQLDAVLGAEFGLGSLKADLVAQYKAALDISISLTDPLGSLLAAFSATASALAELEAAIAAGIAPPSLQVDLTAQADLLVALQLKLGGINALLELAASVRLAGINAAGQLQAALGVGPVALYAATNQPLSTLLSQIAAQDYSAEGFSPSDLVSAILILSKAPGFQAGASVLFPMPPA
jgi:hypothetical protein